MTEEEMKNLRRKKEWNLELEKEKESRNWKLSTWVTTICITALTFLLAYAFYQVQKKIDQIKVYHSVFWNNVDSTYVRPGPAWFYFDSKVDSLKSIKIIGETDKLILLNLVDQKSKYYNSYSAAIDLLAFKTNSENPSSYYLILFLGAICAAIGVHLRTINNFVGVTVFKSDFNIKAWWPWYVMRPLMGVLIGPILFILLEGRLIAISTEVSYSRFIIGLTILAGFGSEDFLETLRSISKRIFGFKPDVS